MRIDCPTCAASYDVPDALLVGRKSVRCARCGGQWTPNLIAGEGAPPEGFPDPVPAAPAAFEPTAHPPSRLAPRPAPAPRSRALGLAWAASVLVLLAGLGAAVAWRGPIARAWPPSLRVYATLGLVHNPGHR